MKANRRIYSKANSNILNMIIAVFLVLLFAGFPSILKGQFRDIIQRIVPDRIQSSTPVVEESHPSNPHIGTDAAKVLNYIQHLPLQEDNRVLSGQNVGHANVQLANGYASFFAPLQSETGQLPAILGIDYGWEDFDPIKIAEANQMIIQHWRNGGLVAISMHPKNPWTNGSIKGLDLGGCAYLDMITPGTAAYTRWMNTLDRVADGLEALKNAGVVVIWRPLHEMNGDWFWWSAGENNGRASPEDFVAVWRHMYTYFTEERNLDNLLWVYGPFAKSFNSLIKPVNEYYPGSSYVDIVALDYYRNTFDYLNDGSYEQITSLGKPLGFGEIGPANWLSGNPNGNWDTTLVINTIREQYPLFTYFLFWHSYGNGVLRMEMAMIENQNTFEFLNDPWVVNLGEVHWDE
jgi:mannan endo-1,4-beta-mannosidase